MRLITVTRNNRIMSIGMCNEVGGSYLHLQDEASDSDFSKCAFSRRLSKKIIRGSTKSHLVD